MSSSDDVHQKKTMCIVKNEKRLCLGGGGDDNTDNSRFVGCCKVFGVKGRDNLCNLYYGILALLKANRGKLCRKMCVNLPFSLTL